MALGQTFVGAGGGGGGGSLIVKDEGSTLTSAATSLDVVGAGAKATNVGGAVTLRIPAPTNAAYFRLYIDNTGVNSFVSFAEIALHSSVGGSQLLTGGTPSASSSFSGSFDAPKALDSNLTTAWVSSGAVPQWWEYDFAAAVDFVELVITARNGADYAQAPTRFSVLASTDGVIWSTVREFFTTWASANQVKTFALI